MTAVDSGLSGTLLERADVEQLERVGISRAEAERQLALLAEPPPAPRLVRACRIGDGVERLDDEQEEELERRGRDAAVGGRVAKFVPASGAASRMFEALVRGLEAGGRALDELASALEKLPFAADLEAAMSDAGLDLESCLRCGDRATVVRHLLQTPGLGYLTFAKGLIPFHSYAEGARTAFEEHLVEAIGYTRDGDGLCRLHFTVARSQRRAFEALLERVREALFERYGARFEVSFSIQSPATDTLAVDLENRPFRLEDGRLLLRPGGHGALLANLADLGGDVVLVKNIDNVVPEVGHELIARWKRVLAGYLVALQARAFELLADLEPDPPAGSVLEAGFEFLARELGDSTAGGIAKRSAASRRAYLIDRLDRPIRVCGVVRNEGEPGGGPFWVKGEGEAERPQIVERSQIDAGDETQAAIFDSGTHFNPVDLACGMRDRHGRPFDLDRFVDPRAVFIAPKSRDGRKLKALERPGLWNGAMARWNTLFVEVPAATFAPVKTVFDLLRPAHQAPRA